MARRVTVQNVEQWTCDVVREMASEAKQFFSDDSDPDSWITIVVRDDLEGFGKPLSAKVRKQLSGHERATREKHLKTYLELARTVVQNARHAARLADSALSLSQLTESLGADHATYGRIADSESSLRSILADCARRGDTSWDWVDDGGRGLYLILTFYAA